MQSFASSSGKLSREEWRRQKDLDAARKAGTAPAEIGEDGEVINPHVPEYMSKAPWYLETGKRSLKHQKKPDTGEQFVGINEWYQRGQRTETAVATKYRKGACDNCGAMTHKTKDCLERPRKKGAKWTNKDIAPDEYLADLGDKKVDFAAKRDRWNGYDPAEHKRIMQQYEAVEEERRRMREEQIDKQMSTDLSEAKKLAKRTKKKPKKQGGSGAEGDGEPAADPDFSSSDEDDVADEKDKYAESASMAGQKVDTDNRMSIRNLRIREDRAKYLYNLDPNSAYYDPKTRSMREAPDALRRPEDSQFAGDNFNRNKGDSVAMQRLQLFAWQAEARGNDLHLQANPTVNEKQFREFQQKKEKLRESTKGSILERYGGAQHFDSIPKELLSGQTEDYVEYSRSGKVVKGQERAKAKSRFEEDVFEKNHTQVWGSWYDLTTGQWGYKCCHSTLPNSYCTGQAGIEASRASGVTSTIAKALQQPINADDPAAPAGSGVTNGRESAASRQPGNRGRSRSISVSLRSSYSSTSRSRSRGSDSDFSDTDESDQKDQKSRKVPRKRKSHRSENCSSRRRRCRSSASLTSSHSRSDDENDERGGNHERYRRRPVEGFTSRKQIGEGDVSARLDKDKLKAALADEDRRRDGKRSAEASRKPDWLREAEAINSGAAAVARKRGGAKQLGADVDEVGGGKDDTEVTEEQMEAYRLKNRNDYEDPMANYRDVGDSDNRA